MEGEMRRDGEVGGGSWGGEEWGWGTLCRLVSPSQVEQIGPRASGTRRAWSGTCVPQRLFLAMYILAESEMLRVGTRDVVQSGLHNIVQTARDKARQ